MSVRFQADTSKMMMVDLDATSHWLLIW